jgi:hypothetical protein
MSRAANGAAKPVAELKSRSGWGWDETGASSSSLRYTTLEGNLEQESDSLIRQVLLLDLQSGNISPIRTPEKQKLGETVPWPKPLSKDQLSQVGDSDKLATLSIGVDSTIRAVEAGDRLLIDRLLLIPGKTIVYLDGDVAF